MGLLNDVEFILDYRIAAARNYTGVVAELQGGET